MENFRWRVRVSVMWVFGVVAFTGYAILAIVRPGAMDEVMAGRLAGEQITSVLLVLLALFWLIPLAMAFLSLVLADFANKWANIILGVVFGLLNIGGALGEITSAQPSVALLLMEAAKIVAAVLIVWHGWRWPAQER